MRLTATEERRINSAPTIASSREAEEAGLAVVVAQEAPEVREASAELDDQVAREALEVLVELDDQADRVALVGLAELAVQVAREALVASVELVSQVARVGPAGLVVQAELERRLVKAPELVIVPAEEQAQEIVQVGVALERDRAAVRVRTKWATALRRHDLVAAPRAEDLAQVVAGTMPDQAVTAAARAWAVAE